MDLNAKKIFKTLNPNKIWVPVILGVGIVVYLFISDERVTIENLSLIRDASPVPLLLAAFVFVARFAGYMYRIKFITEDALNWRSSLYVIILWEFASAVTPSVVGGTAVAVFILWKEGIKPGKALGYVMLTAIFDNLFFVLATPLVLLMGFKNIFPVVTEIDGFSGNNLIIAFFFISYALIAIYTFIMSFALLINPRLFKWILIKVTSIKFLRRWRYGAYERGTEMILASEQIRNKGKIYWVKLSLSTIFIWSSRYLMLNCIGASLTKVTLLNHAFIFGKQIILWVVMLIAPTPGSSGVAEAVFPYFFIQLLGDYTFITNILWRLFTYYPYLLLGAIFLPKWIKIVFLRTVKS